ncbi:MAG: spore germination protein GerW family protein [Eubacteriales bacterium]|nr:spore germination protein GerW family protein [Eubacteriales bacterium]
MDTKKVNELLQELFDGVETFVDSKTVVGDAQFFGDTVIVPLVEVSFAMGAGAFDSSVRKKNSSRAGLGGKIKPSAVLVIKDGAARIVNVGKTSAIEKAIDLAPELMNRFTKGKDATKAEKDEILHQAFGDGVHS